MRQDHLEIIFSNAAALTQSGRLRSTIYCSSKTVFILNGDFTVLLKFSLPSHISGFERPVSFKADDYESGKFYEQDGKVLFKQFGAEFDRTKSCKAPGLTFSEVNDIWESFNSAISHSNFIIHKKSLSLMEDGLSHLEFSSKDNSLTIIQRDIFAGTIITLTRKKGVGLAVHSPDKITKDFGPMGIRTNDFMALYSFHDSIEFGLCDKSGFMKLKSGDMEGIIAHCIYDELGKVEVLNGREKQENRGSVQGSDRPLNIRRPIQKPKA